MELINDGSTLEQQLMNHASKTKTPINGSLELLPLCNMNCDMCYVRLSREEMESHGRLHTGEEWLKVGKELAESGTVFLLLTGGEPLLHPDFKEIYLGLKKLGFIITINSNGTLINQEWAEFFGKNKPRRINITLYGTDSETYKSLCHYDGYDKVINGIKLLRENNVDVKISGSLTPQNINELESFHDIEVETNIPVRIDTYMMSAQRERTNCFNQESRVSPEEAARIRILTLYQEMGEQEFNIFREVTLKEIESDNHDYSIVGTNCLAGNCSFTIHWNGEVAPCVILSETHESVFDTDFKTCWNHIVESCSTVKINDKCAHCKYRPLCRTCAACALLEAGSYDALPEYMCRYAEESYIQLKNWKTK